MEILEVLEQKVKSLFSSENSGHDIYHLKRVLNIALHLQKTEGGDKMVIAVSALLHDVHRLIQLQTGKYCSPKDSLPKVKEILGAVDLPEEKVEKILKCIEFHEEYGFSKDGRTVTDIETLILQDADRLDAIGAVGIGRCFTYCAVNNIPMWVPGVPLVSEDYKHHKHDPSTIHHFYNKLLRLKDDMNTKTAKKMALDRHNFMELFVKHFFAEWEGKK